MRQANLKCFDGEEAGAGELAREKKGGGGRGRWELLREKGLVRGGKGVGYNAK